MHMYMYKYIDTCIENESPLYMLIYKCTCMYVNIWIEVIIKGLVSKRISGSQCVSFMRGRYQYLICVQADIWGPVCFIYAWEIQIFHLSKNINGNSVSEAIIEQVGESFLCVK